MNVRELRDFCDNVIVETNGGGDVATYINFNFNSEAVASVGWVDDGGNFFSSERSAYDDNETFDAMCGYAIKNSFRRVLLLSS